MSENAASRTLVDSIVHRLSWPEIRARMKAGEPLRWLPIHDTPGQKRAVFIGNDRLDNDSSLEVHRAEARRELLVEPATKAYGFVDSFVGTLRLPPVKPVPLPRGCQKCGGERQAIDHNSGIVPGIGYEEETKFSCNQCHHEWWD